MGRYPVSFLAWHSSEVSLIYEAIFLPMIERNTRLSTGHGRLPTTGHPFPLWMTAAEDNLS
ncbi:unnamed protein product [Nezara viridula]|uniref:Uncharacterized protein n=1 Tax=Nezara viridula TaxID=85310 RepID=A0A9P0H1T3_NEZVI|nr:unnamed protein product [Nezara viridula]